MSEPAVFEPLKGVEWHTYYAMTGNASFTWWEFLRDWEHACNEAWGDQQQEPAITLPSDMFPSLTAVANPVTGRLVRVARVSMFTWEKL